jgi:hypothetical protein
MPARSSPRFPARLHLQAPCAVRAFCSRQRASGQRNAQASVSYPCARPASISISKKCGLLPVVSKARFSRAARELFLHAQTQRARTAFPRHLRAERILLLLATMRQLPGIERAQRNGQPRRLAERPFIIPVDFRFRKPLDEVLGSDHKYFPCFPPTLYSEPASVH